MRLRRLPGQWGPPRLPRALAFALLLFPLLFGFLLARPSRAAAQELPSPAEGGAGAAALRVAAVQLSVDPEMLASLEAYRARMTEQVEESLAYGPDLIVFPEYTGALLALIPHAAELAGARTVAEGLERIRKVEPLVGDLRDLFLLESGWVERAFDEVFGGLARRSGAAILAGSYFAWQSSAEGSRLVNRAVVFGVDGKRLYRQDKVYLTPFEEELLGLSSGRLRDARPFAVDGARVGLTICRDSFFPAWERRIAGSDLWIDIKANGAAYDEQEQARFRRALPARLGPAGVPFGLTVCLTGQLLDLLWEGESSLVQAVGGEQGIPSRLVTLSRAASPRAEQVLLLAVPLAGPGR